MPAFMRCFILGLRLRRSSVGRVGDPSALAAGVVRSLPCFEGDRQTQGYRSSHRSILGVEETSPSVRIRADSHPSAEEQLSSRRKSPLEPERQGPGQETHLCGREDREVDVEENVEIKTLRPRMLVGQDLYQKDPVVNHSVPGDRTEAILQKKYARPRNRRRKRKHSLGSEKKYKTSGKSESEKKSSSEGTGKSRNASSVSALNRQIRVLMDSGYREEAYAVYEKIRRAGCKPDSYTYLHLIKGFCEGGELKQAQGLFRKFCAGEGISCGRSEVILYNAMVHGLGSAGFVQEALDLVEEMTERGLSPDRYTYNSILHTLGKVGKVAEASIVFESMAGKGCAPDVVTYNSIIKSLGKAGRARDAYEIYERMIEKGCVPDLLTFNTLLPILGKTGELDLVLNLYKFMTTIGCEPNVYTYTSLVTSFCRANRVDDALLVSVEMTEKGCAPNTVTFNTWLDGLCKGGRVVEAHLLFEKMLVSGYVPDKITYCILIDAYCKTGQYVDKSFGLLKDLLKCTCIFDRRTSEIVYQSFRKVGMLKQAKRVLRNARAKTSLCHDPENEYPQLQDTLQASES